MGRRVAMMVVAMVGAVMASPATAGVAADETCAPDQRFDSRFLDLPDGESRRWAATSWTAPRSGPVSIFGPFATATPDAGFDVRGPDGEWVASPTIDPNTRPRLVRFQAEACVTYQLAAWSTEGVTNQTFFNIRNGHRTDLVGDLRWESFAYTAPADGPVELTIIGSDSRAGEPDLNLEVRRADGRWIAAAFGPNVPEGVSPEWRRSERGGNELTFDAEAGETYRIAFWRRSSLWIEAHVYLDGPETAPVAPRRR